MPMNKYTSINRTLRARNIYNTTINPPNDLSLASANFDLQLLTKYKDSRSTVSIVESYFNENANIIIHSIGVFSNFADGLVFKERDERLDIKLNVVAATRTALTGTVTTAAGSTVLTGVAGTTFDTELVAEDIIMADPAVSPGEYHIIDTTPVAANVGALRDEAKDSEAAITFYRLDPVGSFQYAITNISELNKMQDISLLIQPRLFSTSAATELVIQATCNRAGLLAPFILLAEPDGHNCDFLTKSINATYATDAIHFDIVADVEYTGF